MPRKLRLVTGIVLFAFVTGHLLNLAFGLVSVDLLDRLRPWFMKPWQNPVGMWLLIASMLVHGLLGLVTLYQRNTLRMTRLDAAQLLLGLAIVPLLVPHVLGTAVAMNLIGAKPSYASILTVYWVLDPVAGVRQVLVLVATWIHGCMGLFIWMRLQSWWPRIAGLAYPLVVVIPVLALLGLVEAGKEVIALQDDPAFMAPVTAALEPVLGQIDRLRAIERNVLIGFGVMLVLVLVARAIRLRGAEGVVRLAYEGGPEITIEAGPTLLEISHIAEVPHASLCGGRGRCGTCRVRLLDGQATLPSPTALELATLTRLDAPADVRLACQVAPRAGRLRIERLLPAHVEPGDLHADRGDASLAAGGEGQEATG